MSIFLQISELQLGNSLLSHPFIFTLLPLFLVFFLIKWLSTHPTTKNNLPPSPSRLPIIGNLHQLGLYPHRSLRTLAQKHGPVMLLHLGSVPVLVVSSADGAREIMKTHDLIFSNRPNSDIIKKLFYDFNDLSVAPYGEFWRQMKSICVVHLLSNKRFQSIRKVREEETAVLVKKIYELSSSTSCSEVDLSELFVSLTNDVVCRTAFGRKYSGGESGKKFRKMMSEFIGLLGRFDVGTFIPWLGWVKRFNGLGAKVERIAKEMDEFLDGVVEEHLDNNVEREKNGWSSGREDFTDVLLGIYEDDSIKGFSIQRDNIKALLLDIFAGGTDTTYTVLEWAMTELLRHPKILKQLQNEVRGILRGKPDVTITEDDLEKMQYLKAVIKETLRLHPPIPLLAPREAREDVKVMGYDIAAGTMVFTNSWAIGRDPCSWNEPEEFNPERFLNSSIDFKGHDFQLTPFGAGRRGCPGISFAMATNELVLATLVNKFDWELPNGVKGEDLDMTESTGLTIHRKVPLRAVATPCSC